VQQRATLHEVAHAWTHQNLSDTDRARFLQLRGLDHWNEPARWDRQGAEHVAELIDWGLLDVEKRVLEVTPNDRDSLIDGFRFLTGVVPEHDTPPAVELVDLPGYDDEVPSKGSRPTIGYASICTSSTVSVADSTEKLATLPSGTSKLSTSPS
jgi:hypothetical protein